MTDHTQPSPSKKPTSHNAVLYGLGFGLGLGLIGNLGLGPDNPTLRFFAEQICEPIGGIFLRLLLMTVVPLVFSSLVAGVAGLGDLTAVGRIGLRTLAYTLIISAISVVIGLSLANSIKPGERMPAEIARALQARYADPSKPVTEPGQSQNAKPTPALTQFAETLIPKNPLHSLSSATPNMLHLMFFALALGIAATRIGTPAAGAFCDAMQSLASVSGALIELVMKFAPVAVAALVFTNVALFGLDLIQALFWYVVTVLLGLGLQMFGVYSVSVKWLSGIAPLAFFKRIQLVMLTAFSTSSSNATLPTTLAVAERELGVPRPINSFVLTIGATANQNGTALYEGVTVLFLAQLAGLHLDLAQQLMVVYLAILGGIGTAGVPAGSIPFVVGVLAMIGVSPSLIAVVLGVDRILDMCRTTLNVVGDITAATYIARSEGHSLAPDTEKPTD